MAGRPNTKWLATMQHKLGSREAVTERMRHLGSIGGAKTGVKKGFAANKELARKAGAIGGAKSRPGKKAKV